MGAIQIPAAAFRYSHEYGRLTDAAHETEMDQTWTPVVREGVSDEEIEQVIERIAESGYFDDELGQQKKASELHQSTAIVWVDDKKSLPGYVYTAFLKWATHITALAKYGRRG